mgnify:CR=1 FL=1
MQHLQRKEVIAMIKTQEWNDRNRTMNYFVYKDSVNNAFDLKLLIGAIWNTQQYYNILERQVYHVKGDSYVLRIHTPLRYIDLFLDRNTLVGVALASVMSDTYHVMLMDGAYDISRTTTQHLNMWLYGYFGDYIMETPQQHTPRKWRYDNCELSHKLNYRERCNAYPWDVPKELMELVAMECM